MTKEKDWKAEYESMQRSFELALETIKQQHKTIVDILKKANDK